MTEGVDTEVPSPAPGPSRLTVAFWLAVGAVAVGFGVDLTVETWGEPSHAPWVLGAATLIAVGLAFAALFFEKSLGVLSLGLVWVSAVATWLTWPTWGRGGAVALGLGDDARTAFVLTAVFALLPVAVGLFRFRWWVLPLVPVGLWSVLPLVAGVVRDEPFEDFPLFRAFWGELPTVAQPAQTLVLVFLPTTLLLGLVMSLVRRRDSVPVRSRVLEGAGWLLIVAATLAICLLTVRAAHVPSPLREIFPPIDGVGEATIVLGDGSSVRVTTAGYDSLSDEERASKPQWRIQARGDRSPDASARTRLWLNVLDERGRNVLDRRREDFEVFDGGTRRDRVEFSASPDEGPPSFAPPHIWIANSAEGSVSKLSTRTGEEEGRYTVRPDPSRTSVDLDGNVYVGQRADGSLSKILARGCEGAACVAWTVKTCGGPRGLAVARDNSVWVGGNTGAQGCLERRSPADGALLFATETSSRVYGLALDQRGHLWAVLDMEGLLLRFRPDGRLVGRYETPEPSQLYGIAIDGTGGVWLGNNGKFGVWHFDPAKEAWTRITSDANPTGASRGVAADAAGNIWVANSNLGLVSRFAAGKRAWVADYPSGGAHPVGVAIDGDQFVWVVHKGSHDAVRMDPTSGDIVGTYAVGKGPYTYSDMTGYALHNFVARTGTYHIAWHRTPLRVAIVAPEAGTRIPAVAPRAPVVLVPRIEAYDPEDPVRSVTWKIDGETVATVTEPPFRAEWKYRETQVGRHEIELIGQTQSGFEASAATHIEAVRTFGELRVQLKRGDTVLEEVPRTIEFVVDSSGSMWGALPAGPDGRRERKIDAAKRVLEALFMGLPANTTVSLRAYGHRTKRCDDTELLVEPGAPDTEVLVAKVRGLRPKGRTPIARSLEAAGDDLRARPGEGYLGERMVVLVTDGIETCKGDPCMAAARLSESLRLRSHVVGFGLSKPGEADTLRCIADRSGGTYADADNADDLRRVLEEAIQVHFEVVRVDPEAVVHRGALDRAEVVLPVGRYFVRFGSSGSEQVLASRPFEVVDQRAVDVALLLATSGPPEIVVLDDSRDANSPP